MLSDDLDDFLTGDNHPLSSGSSFQGSDDDFDPTSLLSSPLFDDSGDDLNIILDLDHKGQSVSGVSQFPADTNAENSNFQAFSPHLQLQQQQILSGLSASQFQHQSQIAVQQRMGNDHIDQVFHDQQLPDLQGSTEQLNIRSEYEATANFLRQNQMSDNLQQNQFSNFSQQSFNTTVGGGMMIEGISNQQAAMDQQVFEIQQKLQQVQQHLLNVQGASSPLRNQINQPQQQLQSSQTMMQPQMLQGMGPPKSPTKNMNRGMRAPRSPSKNMAGMSRTPPGRSISMPAQRQGNPQLSLFSNSFAVQQQQQQQNAVQAMSQSFIHVSSDHGSNPPQQPIQMDLSTRSVPTEIGGGAGMLNMMQQAAMQGGGNVTFAGGAVRNNSLPMRNNSLPKTEGIGGGGGFDLTAMAQSYAASQQGGGQLGVNDAMEKLCESMRRSAMSRTLVKQLSGRSLHMSPSGRNIQRTNSGRRNIVRASSGRQVARTSSSGKGLHGVTDLQPVRRMAQESKHRMTPTRGVFRHHSSTAAMGAHGLAAMQQQQQNSLGRASLHDGLDPSSLHNMEKSPMHSL